MLYSMLGFNASLGGDKRDEECPYIGTGTPGDVAALALS